mmetsp:Transcript_3764/g.9613  ORF Transcript_3764/g.9613 Transcript_3764/m.9613 type:complete len:212 (+) Transcript_3764:187-822(+)
MSFSLVIRFFLIARFVSILLFSVACILIVFVPPQTSAILVVIAPLALILATTATRGLPPEFCHGPLLPLLPPLFPSLLLLLLRHPLPLDVRLLLLPPSSLGRFLIRLPRLELLHLPCRFLDVGVVHDVAGRHTPFDLVQLETQARTQLHQLERRFLGGGGVIVALLPAATASRRQVHVGRLVLRLGIGHLAGGAPRPVRIGDVIGDIAHPR